ncbi:PREDICTED: interleukin-10 receptor subunit alpha [Tinamus guttatus]|uniref:interleukin-10 receptor subunit alpha n=1 Tax=Tinamus guttatus TaxID=94827 RepID=UPI00052ED9BB|nr:PREDICTED: interleukin-10 receptor subunit alpha [Tinamus guttatus]
MASGTAALALRLALLLALHAAGEQLPGPAHVRFAANIAHPLLRWEPGPDSPRDVRYDVEHGVYGPGFSWTAVPSCTRILGHSCDLTFYTLDPEQRYYAQVRAVSGNRTSPWKRTSSFSPKEGSRSPGQSLSVTGNTIVVKLQLLLKAGNSTVRYEDIQRHARRYKVYVRQAQDNRMYEVLETQPEFNISNLFWDTEYCVSVEPDVASRPVHTMRTAEQCVTIGRRDESAELLLSIVSIIFITMLLLLLLGMLLVCMYIKKPVRPPSVLKSFLKQGSLWVEQEYSPSTRSEPDPVQQLFLCQKAPQQPGTSITVLQQMPEQACALVARPEHRARLLGPSTASGGDCSGSSTDSGICLHNSSPKLGMACQRAGVQPPGSEDSGISMERASPCLERYQTAKETRPQPAEHGPPAATTGEDGPQEVQFRGYLQQCKGTVEPTWDRGKEPPLWGHTGPVHGTDVVQDMACAELPVAKGYMKQSPPAGPHGHTQDLRAPGSSWQPPAWGFPSELGPLAPDVASCGGSIGGPELLKASLELGISSSPSLGSLPLISSLSTNTWLSLQLNPLGVLQAGSKDSRL